MMLNFKFHRPVRPRRTMDSASRKMSRAFTLIELLVTVTLISVLAGLLIPSLQQVKAKSRRVQCLSNQRQIGLAALLYMQDHDGSLFHHHEGWVLDDGTQSDELPSDLAGCSGGGQANSHAEKPWVIIFQPYLASRQVAFCPADRTPRSRMLARDLRDFNGLIRRTDEEPPETTELALARKNYLTTQSYLLNSIFTHRSARYAFEGVLPGFATSAAISALPNPNLIFFSERNSEALNAPDNFEYGSVAQDDYDTWTGEAALVRWGQGSYGNEGWIRHNRHAQKANYIYFDGHAETLPWRAARQDQYPDHEVRAPLATPP
jgi:prepilin-type N-terminal cleavage/methylation domain-containing protein/prepilin-type processing-associated H-X9-DG protein